MEIQLYFQLIKRGWWIVLLTTLATIASVLGYSILVTPKYEASARLILNPSPFVSLSGPDRVLDSLNTLDRDSIIATYAEIMNSNRVYQEALSSLQLQPTNLAEYSYETDVISNSYLIEIKVKGPDANMAASVANAIGYQTIYFTEELNQVIELDFLDMAVPPSKPYRPNPLRDSLVGAVFGLVGGLVLAILREQLRIPWDAIKRQLQLDSMTGVYTRKHFSDLLEEEIVNNPDKLLSIGIVELTGLDNLLVTLPITGLRSILQKVSEVLRKELRGNDLIGRWNEKSFIVLLPNTQAAAAQRIFERIFESLSKPVELELFDTMVNLDAHIGGAEYSNNIASEELLDKAKNALENSHRDADTPISVWKLKNPFWTQPSGENGF
jgi:diguanylate cyclase (GGDEF)-like protein